MDSFIRKKIPFFLNNWNLPNFLRNSSLRHKTACASHLAYSTFRTEISNFWLLLSWLFRWCFSNEFYMIIFHILLMTTDQAFANDGSLYPMHIQLCVTMYVCLFVYLFLWYSLVQHLNRSTKCDIRVLIALSREVSYCANQHGTARQSPIQHNTTDGTLFTYLLIYIYSAPVVSSNAWPESNEIRCERIAAAVKSSKPSVI